MTLVFSFSCRQPSTGEKVEDREDQKAGPVPSAGVLPDSLPEPEGMVLFRGGQIVMGSESPLPNQGPPFERFVEPFYLDVHPVTVGAFRKFILETGFRTEADKFGNAGVFDLAAGQWSLVDGANWENPFGRGREKAANDHPVTQVSWNDAVAYCLWAGKRLPTEAEWESAARNGENTGDRFPWGNELNPAGKFMANHWQGNMTDPQGADGFVYTSAVGYYGYTPSGLTDMSGNVWEWCADTFRPYPGSRGYFNVSEETKTIRGGSFFYDAAGEESLTVWYRAGNTTETSLFNMGFRCARNP